MVIILNKDSLNGLFKPYAIVVEDELNYLSDAVGISDEKFLLETAMYLECSKSIDESCINSNCAYNLIDEHSSDLYLKIKEDGGVLN